MDELELKERAGKFVYQLYSNNRKTLIELFEAAFTRMDDYKARAERAEAERAALRAELAEARAGQQWRPGREPRPGAGWYLAYDFSQDDRPLYWYDNGNGESNPDWFMPIPPLPAAPDADAGEE